MSRRPIYLCLCLLALLLQACSSGDYDREREWRLRECEKILDDRDRSNCVNNTPHYKR